MIFVGDIAHPFETSPSWTEMQFPWSRDELVVANLEGAIVREARGYASGRVLYNHSSILNGLQKMGIAAVGLANNHISDIVDGIELTRASLIQRDIVGFGAGATIEEAMQPARLPDHGREVALLGFGWETIECKAADSRRRGVAPLRPATVFRAVEAVQAETPGAEIVAFMHWNYEMEAYPQPAHRQLAMELIDRGVSAVIGHHPHCVAGIEVYKGKPIAYSLGNWWMPQGVYFDGRLSYAAESRRQLALEWNFAGVLVCHWFEYDPETHSLSYDRSELAADSPDIQALTPFQGMASQEYCEWFRRNRRKRRFLPIYGDFHSEQINRAKDAWVKIRHLGIQGLERTKIRRLLRI